MGATYQTTKIQWWAYEFCLPGNPTQREISSQSPPSDFGTPGWIGWKVFAGPFASQEEAYRATGWEVPETDAEYCARIEADPEFIKASQELKKKICPQCGAYDTVLAKTGSKAHTCPDDKGQGKTFASVADLSTGKPETLKEVGPSTEEIISGEMKSDEEKETNYFEASMKRLKKPEGAPVLAHLSTSDPVVNKILAALHEAHDTCLALGQRVFALEAEVNALRGELSELRPRPQAPPAPDRFRPSHYSQVQVSSDDELREAFKRWLGGR